MKRALLLTVGAVLLALPILADQKDLGTGYELENVEVLDKSMRLADARVYMIEFNDALSVQCRDCHDLRDFASDVKELKLVARDMMKMQKEINENWFPDAEAPLVSCYTCHQGARIPASQAGDIPLLSGSK